VGHLVVFTTAPEKFSVSPDTRVKVENVAESDTATESDAVLTREDCVLTAVSLTDTESEEDPNGDAKMDVGQEFSVVPLPLFTAISS
jgi:hypothetical protein